MCQGIKTRSPKVVPLKVPPNILPIWPLIPPSGSAKRVHKGTTSRVPSTTPKWCASQAGQEVDLPSPGPITSKLKDRVDLGPWTLNLLTPLTPLGAGAPPGSGFKLSVGVWVELFGV